jgi:hypothetical protein
MKNAAPRPGHERASRSCVRVVERKLLRQVKHPLPILSASNPQENLHQFQTTEVYGRALRAWPARVQSANVWAGSGRAYLSSFAPSARWRAALPGARRREKFLDIRREGASQLLKNRDAGIHKSPFKTADISPVDSGIDGKHLLRELARDPKPAYVSSNQRLCFHQARSAACGPLNHGQSA